MASPVSQKASAVRQLQREILSLQGLGVRSGEHRVQTGLGAIEAAFPQRTFPTAAVHEFISADGPAAAATSGFICGLLRQLTIATSTGTCLWVGTRCSVYPPALKAFGIAPERIMFVDVANDRDALWAVEEALKCEGLAAVVGEVRELDFTASRRLQLAVERSRITGFIHRKSPRTEGTNACVARWRITPLASAPADGLPGVGHPRWHVRLQKIRNGRPGAWPLEWTGQGFRTAPLIIPSSIAITALPAHQKIA